MQKQIDNNFYIHTPYFSAWEKYHWTPGEWSVGLEKKRIDKLAIMKSTDTVYVNVRNEGDFTIKASKVKTFPVEKIKNYDRYVYVVRRSALNRKINKLKDPEEFSKLVL